MKNLNSEQITRLMGKVYYFDNNLYGQVKETLLRFRNVVGMLEEVTDEIVKAYLTQEKGALHNELLRYGVKREYPDYPQMAEETVD